MCAALLVQPNMACNTNQVPTYDPVWVPHWLLELESGLLFGSLSCKIKDVECNLSGRARPKNSD